jgi:hypothetical protein
MGSFMSQILYLVDNLLVQSCFIVKSNTEFNIKISQWNILQSEQNTVKPG